jgi:hypothetical protein
VPSEVLDLAAKDLTALLWFEFDATKLKPYREPEPAVMR